MKRALAPIAAFMLAGCDLSMTRQDRHAAQSSPSLWPGGPVAAAAPEGAVAQDQPGRDASLAQPPVVTEGLLRRGRERYTIYCAPCHGADGTGQGPVVLRGFPQPARFADARGGAGSAQHIVDVEGAGYGIMYGFAYRIEPTDRWAIAAYVKVLAQPALIRLGPSPSGEVSAHKADRAGGSAGGVPAKAPSVSLRERPLPKEENFARGLAPDELLAAKFAGGQG